ncbi:unnamed protein product [Acanthoscelides obtectus]|uniref:Uncharacterized protein n=1 Tax=Acanthoscelides obtectus TaxID=200917 RepID=A0A9P0KFY7_ACAOB|nr:unnamed protein product [Acanthoscelides obtectus]CAK1675302.1 hypothetical protein AOBTE_LOCUS30118 [Acanthoscelides obtectus]
MVSGQCCCFIVSSCDKLVRGVTFDHKNLTFFIDVDIPHIYIEGNYLVEGKIFFAPIRGSGSFHVKLSNSSCLMLQNVIVIKKNGMDFLKPIKTVPKFKVGNIIDYGFDGLFGNSDEINKIAKHVIDDNLSIIVEELLPTIEKVLLEFFENFIFKSVTRIPYDKLYPK